MSVLGGALRGHALRLARLLEELDGPARRAVRAGHPDPTAPERELLARTAHELDVIGSRLQSWATTAVESRTRLQRLEHECADHDLRLVGAQVAPPPGPSRTDPAERLRSQARLQTVLTRIVSTDTRALADLERDVAASMSRLERLSMRARAGRAGWTASG